MKSPSSLSPDGFRNSRAGRSGRLIPLAALLILFSGFATTWVSASRDHPARVSFMDGSAAYETGGDVDWNKLTLNLPLVSGDRIMGHPESRIEVELGDGNLVRISGETDVLFPELSQKKTILKLHQGDLILRVTDASRVQVDLDQASVKIRKPGLYRIKVDPDGSIRVVVHEGRAEVGSRHGKERVETGQQLLLDARQIGIQAVAREMDAFELWSGKRDAAMAGSRSVAYMGGVDYPGVQSLDEHGYWAHAGSYGHVWVPDASEGWAPYRFGRWRYLSTGLTWVSHEPWGWLPYHYGRWIYYGPMSRWAWVPGGFNRWQPSLVDFYWGGGYLGWAPRGYYTGRNGGRDGLTVVHRNNLGREPTRTRVLPSDGIVGGLRQGLPRDLRRSRVWNRNSAYSNSGVRGSRLASRSPANSRDGIVQGGSRRTTVSRSGAEGARNLQSFRSTSRNRSVSRTSPGSRGSVATRSGRNASRPTVWSSRRSRPANSPTFTSPSGRSSSRSTFGSPSYRTTPTYRRPAPSVSRSPSPRVQAPPRQSGSSGGATRSRSTTRSRN